ncbi:uncharacterized protein LOC142612510 [Castanea sativa]|uniref:uncharacterized protein LOC142612510 n=1 Tax=Castanea sativa TaxID=21020 RepID=UPI003F653036
MAIEIGISQLEIFGNSKLIINQIFEQHDVKKEDLVPYCKYAKKLLANFEAITFEHIPRKENRRADALANLATTLALSQEETAKVAVSQRWVVPFVVEEEKEEKQANVISVCLVEKEDWRQTIIEYLQHGRLSDDEEAKQALEEAHSGICDAHQSGPKLHYRIKRMGPLPKSSGGHLYILAATDYFSKWAEAVPFREVKKETVVNFIRNHLIYRYGVPRYIITDNGKPFQNRLMTELWEKFAFKQYNSSMYNAPANGLAKAFNKTLDSLLKKMVSKTKRDWHEKIGEAFWAYRTTFRMPTQATPYSLVYGVEAILPLERQIPSLRIAIQEGLTKEENAKLRLQELEGKA